MLTLNRVLSRGQFLEEPYVGHDCQKISRRLSLEISYFGRERRTIRRRFVCGGQKNNRGGRKISLSMVEKLVTALKNFVKPWSKN